MGQLESKSDFLMDDDGKFRVHSRVEILFILRAIMKSNALVTAYFGATKEFVVTAILDINADNAYLIFDSGSNAQANDRLLKNQRLSIVSNQDGVRIQFELSRVESVSFAGRLAFRTPLPESVLKLQRREYFRLPAPVATPLKCQFTSPLGGNLDARIGDISLGGVSLIGQSFGLRLEPGMILENCRIVLPELGTVTTRLLIRNSFSQTLKSGAKTQRIGCAFVNLPASQEAMLQRFIIRLERDRRAKDAE